jgi:hypothetical protein
MRRVAGKDGHAWFVLPLSFVLPPWQAVAKGATSKLLPLYDNAHKQSLSLMCDGVQAALAGMADGNYLPRCSADRTMLSSIILIQDT